ncbi:hypothetical protein D3C72_2294490 [compost metagenome]
MPHQNKRADVEDRADGPEEHHEAADVARIPAQRLLDQFGVDIVEGDGDLRHVIQQVLHQQVQRQHRQKR